MTKVVVVTGAAGSLGSAVARAVAAKGCAVAALDLAPIAEPSDYALGLGGVDLADENAVARAFERISKQFGTIDGLANIAGGFAWQRVQGGSVDTLDSMYRMNLRSAYLVSHCALPLLTEGGAIVNVGAASILDPAEGVAAYAASKAGVCAITTSLADELKERGIRVNAVMPTILDTPANRQAMPDADRVEWVSPAALAEIIASLLLDPGSAPATGRCIVVDKDSGWPLA